MPKKNFTMIIPYATALAAYKEDNGRYWKDQLLQDWYIDHERQRGLLRALRNDPRFKNFNDIFAQFKAYEKAKNEEENPDSL